MERVCAVRCGGQQHTVQIVKGRFVVDDAHRHPGSMAAYNLGAYMRCFDLLEAWREVITGASPPSCLPAPLRPVASEARRLHKQRQYRTSAPRLSLQERLAVRTRSEVLAAYASCNYRTSKSRWAGGEHVVKVEVDGLVPDCSGASEKATSKNGKWSGTRSRHTIWVPVGWCVRTRKAGFTTLKGELVLDVRPDGDAWWVVTTARQSRGFALVPHVHRVRRT